MELRPYQQTALDAIMQAMRKERFLLVQAATGAGKTILFSALIRHCMENFSMRIGVLAHREILIRQARDKLLSVWPEGENKIGLACASVSQDVDLSRPVIIGSPQTLVRRIGNMPPLDLVIIDECHRVPPSNKKSQYKTLLDRLEDYYPKVRILGVTATPYRLGHGYIFGDDCKAGEDNWWPKLHSTISISTLQEQGYLVPLRAKEAENIAEDLSYVSTSKGEFNEGQLSEVMEKEVHLHSAVHAYEEYGEGREHVVVFCVTIQHAEKMQEVFLAEGYSAAVIHSKMSKEERDYALQAFEQGSVRVICNVGVLTEGWDCTAVDCILMCRPTMSPALYVQMVGRGLRIHDGKKDCLLLDLSGNCRRHGDVNEPVVEVGSRAKKKLAEDEEDEDQRMKTCPQCNELVPLAVMECPECGYQWSDEKRLVEAKDVTMADVAWGVAQQAKVLSWNASSYTSRAGNYLFRLSMLCALQHSSVPEMVNYYFDFEGKSNSLWLLGRSRQDWRRLAGTEPPCSIDECVARMTELHIPEKIQVKLKGKYYNVESWSA